MNHFALAQVQTTGQVASPPRPRLFLGAMAEVENTASRIETFGHRARRRQSIRT
jgi:hypothetical protein